MAPQSIIHAIILGICCLTTFTSAQFQFHTDPTRNAFTVTAPGLQQSFTRYFGGGAQRVGDYQLDSQVAGSNHQQVFAPYLNQQQSYPFVPQYQRAFAGGGVPDASAQDSVPQYTQQRYQLIEPQPTLDSTLDTMRAVRFSPSNEVSSVNFSNGDFTYNF
ncbi:uncharacterized protein LOC129807257 [Phlebotomus papatasi]|uniref:uncharacterized protein LOC129807257 n=1 Tax=Phlebotomus papatasi TaxID=29031 RepID=UPI0024847194|nr:uncharacterized protein LOC129807257 [Phlebotomus papatasi]